MSALRAQIGQHVRRPTRKHDALGLLLALEGVHRVVIAVQQGFDPLAVQAHIARARGGQGRLHDGLQTLVALAAQPLRDLRQAPQQVIAEGPLTLPFTLTIEGDEAKMSGTTTLNRRDYNIGESYQDEATVAYAVDVAIELTAKRK